MVPLKVGTLGDPKRRQKIKYRFSLLTFGRSGGRERKRETRKLFVFKSSPCSHSFSSISVFYTAVRLRRVIEMERYNKCERIDTWFEST